jgi:serine phosphatase RsbU (regulator of sigma subunit)
MSLLGSEMLKEIIISKNIIRPDLILNALHLEIRTTLKQKENNSRDGMDIAVCAYNKTEKKLFYAGAHNPLVYAKNGNIEVIKADAIGIGGEQREQQRIFKLHEIRISAPVWVYIFSDGFQDQFGGNEGRKFMSKNFRQLLLNISTHNGTAQIDDVLVIGVEIS